MLQLVIKNGVVIATHTPEQNLRGRYPDAEIVLSKAMGVEPGDLDPRTREEKRNSYQDLRRMAYPSITDQLDMLYWDYIHMTHTWGDAITAIKSKYPKPETQDEQE